MTETTTSRLEKPQKILVAGASARQNAALFSAAGFEVVAIDFFGDRDTRTIAMCRRVPGFSEIATEATRLSFDTWVMAGGMENQLDLLQRLDRSAPLLGASLDSIATCRDIKLMDQILKSGGDDIALLPHTILCDGTTLGCEVISRSPQWLTKRTDSSGGLSVSLINDIGPSHRDSSGIAQEFIPGPAFGALFVASDKDCRLINLAFAISDHRSGFRYGGSVSTRIDPENTARITRTGKLIADRTGLRGIFGIDFVCSGPHTFFLEVNPRITASAEITQYAPHEVSQLHIAASRGEPLPDFTRAEIVRGKSVLYSAEKKTIEIGVALSDQLFELAQEDRVRIADVPCAGTRIGPRSPLVTVIADGDHPDETLQSLKEMRCRVERLLLTSQ